MEDGESVNYITPSGKWLLEEPVDSANDFTTHGLAGIWKNEKAGYIGATGQMAIPFLFAGVGRFYKDGIAHGWLPAGEEEYREIFLDLSGQEVLDLADTLGADWDDKYDVWAAFIDGRNLFCTREENPKYGFLDLTGHIAIPPQFDEAYSFKNGLSEVKVNVDGELLSGIIDVNGDWVVPPSEDSLLILESGKIAVAKNGTGEKELRILDNSGKELFQRTSISRRGRDFYDGLLSIWDGSSYGFIDEIGNIVIPPQFDNTSDFHEGAAFVKKDGMIGVIDTTGAYIAPLRDYAMNVPESAGQQMNSYLFSEFSEGLGWLKSIAPYEKVGFVGLDGEWVIPPIYDDASYQFKEGVAWVRQGDRYGILKNPLDVVSPWAEDAVQKAGALGLVTENTSRCYPFAITREKFAELSANLMEKVTGQELDLGGFPFADSGNRWVRKAAQAGLVEGVGDGRTFAPMDTLTREQMAVMLVRAIRVLEERQGITVLTAGDLDGYEDAGEVSSWATEAMGALTASGLLQGTSPTTLSPQDPVTVEQAIVLTYRTYQLFMA